MKLPPLPPHYALIIYEGPCDGGYIYRIVNNTGKALGAGQMIGDNGQTWNLGALAPGDSAVFRSDTPVRQTLLMARRGGR